MEKVFYSEYSSYIPAFDLIGYRLEGNKRFYNIGWGIVHSGTVTGDTGQHSTRVVQTQNSPFANAPGCGNSLLSVDPVSTSDDPQSFSIVAYGTLKSNASACDMWQITHLKVLSNTRNGLQ